MSPHREDAWDPTYSVGHPELDRQHHELLAIINELDRHPGERREDTADYLRRLACYAIEHFRYEEGLLRVAGVEDMDAHMQEHEQYKQKVEDFVRRYASGAANLPKDIRRFLRSWFVEHIINSDRRHIAALRTLAIGR